MDPTWGWIRRPLDHQCGLIRDEPPIEVGGHWIYGDGQLAEPESRLETGENERPMRFVLTEVADFSSDTLGARRSAPN